MHLTRLVCVCMYISFPTSQVNHEMFPKLLHVVFVYLYTQSPRLCWITASLKKNPNKNNKKPPSGLQEDLKARPLRISGLNSHPEVPEPHRGRGSPSQFYTTVLRDEAQSGAWPSTGVSGPTRSVLLSMESSLSWGGGADSDRGHGVEISACKSAPFIWFGAKEMLLCPEEEKEDGRLIP